MDNRFERLNDESEISYIMRMCDNKDKYEITWKDLAKEINRVLCLDYDESAYRKKYQYYKICENDKENDIAEKQGMLEALENKRIEVKKEVIKLQTLRIDDNRKIREQGRNDLYFEEVIRAIRDTNNKVNMEQPTPQEIKRLQNEQNIDNAYILSFADVHFGKEFESVNNEYSVKIVVERFTKLLGETICWITKEHIKELNICALGDLIEGMTLRCSQLQSLRMGIVDQTIKFANFLADWLNELSKYVIIQYYSVMSSNHSQIRPYNSKPNEFVAEDMERVINSMLINRFVGNGNICIHATQDKYMTLNLLGYNIIMLHGHETKDINSILVDLSWQKHIFYDYALIGHYHQEGVISSGENKNNNCEIIRCPSIMGSDGYSDSLFQGSKAGAIFIKFTKKQGKRYIEDVILN